MATLGEDIIGSSGLAPFFRLENAAEISLPAPENRKGEALRARARSLSGFQMEALIRSAISGVTWRLVFDEGPYRNGRGAAPCPSAFLSVGMAASLMNEILALAKIQEVEIRKLKLVQDNCCTMKGSMPKRTMAGGAESIELRVEIDCDSSDRDLNGCLINATYASPFNGLMRGQLTSLFKLGRNGVELPAAKAAELEGSLFADPGQHFSSARPSPAHFELMRPVGPTPKKPVAKGTASGGSSLNDEQDRRLNIGAAAELREDGIKDIRQMQYSPAGHRFVFLVPRMRGRRMPTR